MALYDEIKATPRNKVLGLLSDSIQGVNDFASKPFGYDNPPARMIMGLLGAPEVAQTLDRMSYGDSLLSGSGMTTRVRPEVMEAAMSVAPLISPAMRGAGKVGKIAGDEIVRQGMKAEKAIGPMVTRTMERGGLPAQLLSDMSRGTQSPLTVWHGSPHKFDKFDSSKIGTGEGAQAFGHGLYLAETPDVALQYSNLRAAPNMEFHAGGRRLAGLEKSIADDMIANGKAIARLNAKANGPEWLAAYERIANEPVTRGNLYKVDLPDEHIAKMLDWDKPLSQQPKGAQDALAKIDPDMYHPTGGDYDPTELGQMIYQRLAQKGQDAAATAMRSAGIPGIRYLDGGSRGAGTGSSNFVIFPQNEGLLQILERNGKPIK